ncbi:MAG TPA: sigma-54 dependent transcriptional regulator [Polyangiales bacterium]
MPASILIVDDEKNILVTLSRALRVEGYEVDVAGSGQLGLSRAHQKSYDAILLDVQMPDLDGLELLRLIKADREDVPVLIMSGHASIASAVLATQRGAHDFLEKPISSERLLVSLAAALERSRLEHENRELRERTFANEALLGESQPMQALRRSIQLIADASAPVLITGERGTGKELVARALHEGSRRKRGPLEKLNCAAVPRELVESELFGHEAGAFTGASRQRKGKFERAQGGTLFLDEVADMPLDMQAKLLRVLQEGELERVGGSDLLKVDVRVVAATNKDLDAAMKAGELRRDLYDRLNVLPLSLPPLRERKQDIPLLATRFLGLSAKANDRPDKTLSAGALALLCAYEYPGNVRELRNLIERLVIMTPASEISEREARALLPASEGTADQLSFVPGRSLREMMDDAERGLIRRALDHHQGNVSATADGLGLERSHLYKKMRALGLR